MHYEVQKENQKKKDLWESGSESYLGYFSKDETAFRASFSASVSLKDER